MSKEIYSSVSEYLIQNIVILFINHHLFNPFFLTLFNQIVKWCLKYAKSHWNLKWTKNSYSKRYTLKNETNVF